jgi:hypothetical protein
MSSLEEFAEKYFSEHKGKSVPLDLLLAWLPQNHDHREDGVAIVPSMDLHRWAIKHALNRVVDVEPNHEHGEVTNLFEHGWHKAGPACETHLTQSKARLVRGPNAEGVAIFEVSGEVAEKMQAGTVRGLSVSEEPQLPQVVSNVTESSLTGQRHVCPLPVGETCYWSGDPYAPHEMGF